MTAWPRVTQKHWSARWLGVFVCTSAAVSGYGGEPTAAIRAVMEENLAACNEENLPRLLATMSREMPNRELFIEETQKEWAATDSYARLVDLQVLRQSSAPRANTRLPYATVRIVQTTVTGARKGDEPPSEFARKMVLAQDAPTVEFETLWKKEGGKWRLVANLTAPSPVEK